MPWKTDTEAYLRLYFSCFTLAFYRLKKVNTLIKSAQLFSQAQSNPNNIKSNI